MEIEEDMPPSAAKIKDNTNVLYLLLSSFIFFYLLKKMNKFELQHLRSLPIEGVADRLGIEVTRHKALCPFHDDHHASLSFSQRRNTFRCFACGAHGGTIDLVMQRLNINFKEACRWLGGSVGTRRVASESAQSAGNGGTRLASGTAPSAGNGGTRLASGTAPSADNGGRDTSRPYNEGVSLFDASRYERFFLRPFLNEAARRFLFEERRLDERVVRWCRLTSWCDRRGVPWLQIPYYDREWRLVGVQNRNLVKGALPRFRFPTGSQCGIYNLPVLNRLRPGDELYITEGPSDCWAMLSAGHKAIAIPSATLLSRQDKEVLSALTSSHKGEDGRGLSFHMYPDRDLPGERLFLQLKEVLPDLVHHQLPPDCKDFGEYYIQFIMHNS